MLYNTILLYSILYSLSLALSLSLSLPFSFTPTFIISHYFNFFFLFVDCTPTFDNICDTGQTDGSFFCVHTSAINSQVCILIVYFSHLILPFKIIRTSVSRHILFYFLLAHSFFKIVFLDDFFSSKKNKKNEKMKNKKNNKKTEKYK